MPSLPSAAPSLARVLLAATLTLTGTATMAIEEPRFTVVETAERIELREYAPMIVAETVVDGDLSTASSRGFRAIAGYIFGNNRPRDGSRAGERISMTAPVGATPDVAADAGAGERIAMTAPVGATPAPASAPDDGGPTADARDAPTGAARWRIHFVMPADRTMATLPRPTDPSVTLREMPAARWAAIRFAGAAGPEAVREATGQLLAWIASRGLVPLGAPQLARYDPPLTPPILRRNEVLVRVSDR
jgi:hypothetical protein